MFGSPLIFETDPSRLHLSDGSPPDPGRGSAQAPGSGLAKPEAPDITTSPPLTKKRSSEAAEGARRHARASKTNAHSPSALLRLRLAGLIAHSTRLLEADLRPLVHVYGRLCCGRWPRCR